jgi:hypothetical protein
MKEEKPLRQIRAVFSEETIRVYQAYSPEIAEGALRAQTFVAPFKRGRMTWIKPSFLWMMYRAGWGTKEGQERILGIDILRSGFEWALGHSCISHFVPELYASQEQWQSALKASPVRFQWDPERNLRFAPLPWRSLQVGLGSEAVNAYLDEWIVRIEDVTPLARAVGAAVASRNDVLAFSLLPVEIAYPLDMAIAQRLGCTATSV